MSHAKIKWKMENKRQVRHGPNYLNFLGRVTRLCRSLLFPFQTGINRQDFFVVTAAAAVVVVLDAIILSLPRAMACRREKTSCDDNVSTESGSNASRAENAATGQFDGEWCRPFGNL